MVVKNENMQADEKQEALISVIIPIFNTEKYLNECIDSVLKQSYTNIEVILVNDGSTDGSRDICVSYAKRDCRIKLIDKENGGLSSARNCGIDNSHGVILAFVDSDDIIAHFFLETLYRMMRKTDSDIACCESIKFVEDKSSKAWNEWRRVKHDNIIATTYDNRGLLVENLYEKKRITEIQYKIYKRELFEEIRFPVGKIYEDLATTYKLFLKARSIIVVDCKMYGYRKRHNSILSNKFSDLNMSCIWVSERLKKDLGCDAFFRNAVFDAIFRVNRVAYAKVPFCTRYKCRKAIWQKIKETRGVVFHDVCAKRYERILAAISYGGPLVFKGAVCTFEKMKYVFYSLNE